VRAIALAGETDGVKITYDGVLALLGCLLVALLPLPRRAEGLRIGLFGAVLAFVAYDAMKRTTDDDLAAIPAPSAQPGLVTIPVRPFDTPPITSAAADDEKIKPTELLADFSILRHLRRTGAVSDREYEVKKADILRRV
jgi:hypothetical protein